MPKTKKERASKRKTQKRQKNIYKKGNLWLIIRSNCKKSGGGAKVHPTCESPADSPDAELALQKYIAFIQRRNDPIYKTILEELKTDYRAQVTKQIQQQLCDNNRKNKTTVDLRGDIADAQGVLTPLGSIIDAIIGEKYILYGLVNQIQEEDIDESKKKQILAILQDSQNKPLEFVSKSMSSVMNGASQLGSYLTPTFLAQTRPMKNETNIRFLLYPQSHRKFTKGSSISKYEKDDDANGDFIVYVEPTSYANVNEYFSRTFGSIDDALTTFASSYAGKRQPLEEFRYTWRDNQPEIDQKEYERQLTATNNNTV